ncbi:uncharacterized protein LOC143290219 [Babylonia areolata]|uniref:uncharacterized protein LOC143290219 n=1 Tax=Babylonia areolata TaxID=304850 RepID=UPI003FD1AD5C
MALLYHQEHHDDDHHHHHYNHHYTTTTTITSTTTNNHHHQINNNSSRSSSSDSGGQDKNVRRRRSAYGGRRRGSGGRQGAALLLVLLAVLSSVVPGQALCEDRCERVVPMLSHLRALWSRSFKRVGEKRVSFEEFMVSLVQASSNTGHSRAHRLGNALLNLIGQYQDCVMACEHPFSKRAASSVAVAAGGPWSGLQQQQQQQQQQRPKASFKQLLCDRLHISRQTSPLLEELCMTQGP